MPIKMDTSKINGQLINLKIKLEKAAESAAIERSVNYAVEQIADDLAKRVRTNLKKYGPHKGGIYSYRRYKPYWTPSPPGEPPARITSRLLNSIYVDKAGSLTQFPGSGNIRRDGVSGTFRSGQGRSNSVVARTYVVSVQSDVTYANVQEEGSPDGRVPARPFMGPAYQDLLMNSDWLGHMEKAVVGAVKSTTGFNIVPRRSSLRGDAPQALGYRGSGLDLRTRAGETRKYVNALRRMAKGQQRTGLQNRQARQAVFDARNDVRNRAEQQAFMDYGGEFD